MPPVNSESRTSDEGGFLGEEEGYGRSYLVRLGEPLQCLRRLDNILVTRLFECRIYAGTSSLYPLHLIHLTDESPSVLSPENLVIRFPVHSEAVPGDPLIRVPPVFRFVFAGTDQDDAALSLRDHRDFRL